MENVIGSLPLAVQFLLLFIATVSVLSYAKGVIKEGVSTYRAWRDAKGRIGRLAGALERIAGDRYGINRWTRHEFAKYLEKSVREAAKKGRDSPQYSVIDKGQRWVDLVLRDLAIHLEEAYVAQDAAKGRAQDAVRRNEPLSTEGVDALFNERFVGPERTQKQKDAFWNILADARAAGFRTWPTHKAYLLLAVF